MSLPEGSGSEAASAGADGASERWTIDAKNCSAQLCVARARNRPPPTLLFRLHPHALVHLLRVDLPKNLLIVRIFTSFPSRIPVCLQNMTNSCEIVSLLSSAHAGVLVLLSAHSSAASSIPLSLPSGRSTVRVA